MKKFGLLVLIFLMKKLSFYIFSGATKTENQFDDAIVFEIDKLLVDLEVKYKGM